MLRHVLVILIIAVFSPGALARDCQDELLGLAELLETGGQHHDKILTGANDPKLSAAARAGAQAIKGTRLADQLGRSVVTRASGLADPRIAGELLFGLDVLRSLDAAAFAGTMATLLEDSRVRTSPYLNRVLERGNMIIVSEKFAAPSLRLPYLRAIVHHRAVGEAFLKINNAGQWMASLLSTPGLAPALTAEDLDCLVGFATALATRRVADLQSGVIVADVAEGEWQIARKLGAVVQALAPRRPVHAALDAAMEQLDHYGRLHYFRATP